jgi:hypothetical protein
VTRGTAIRTEVSDNQLVAPAPSIATDIHVSDNDQSLHSPIHASVPTEVNHWKARPLSMAE